MKIIDNPCLGIGLLICVGLAVLGLALMTPAEGQYRSYTMVTSDEETHLHPQMHTSDDVDVSPFLVRVYPEPAQRQAERAQAAASQQRQQSVVRIEGERGNRAVLEQRQDDPFAATPRQQQVVTTRVVRDQPAAQPQMQKAELRDELLFRIVKMRLERGEYEKLVPVVLQMQNPERAIEAMLDTAEKSDNDETIAQVLDVATAVVLQMGQPRPNMFPMMPVPGGMPGMPTPNSPTMPFGMGMPGAMPGGMQGGMSGAMPGMPGMMPPGAIMPGMPPGPGQPILWDGMMQGPNQLKR